MPKVKYSGQSYECGSDSVLDCLTAQGIYIPSSCHSGICQTCMMRAISGRISEKARGGIKPTLAEQNYFLACSCFPEDDIEVSLPDAPLQKIKVRVDDIEHLCADVVGIRLRPLEQFNYKAGQFIRVFKDESTVRCYSIASVPELDDLLFLNVKRVTNGLVSGWFFEHLKAGDEIQISEAAGECFYVSENRDQSILLIATGTGLAPLYGIIRDAISKGHLGKIQLYHGENTNGLYLVNELKELARGYPNFKYVPYTSTAQPGSPTVVDIALKEHPNLSGWRIFLCGNPNMVNSARQQTFLAGASMRDIYVDPFNPAN